MFSLDYSIRPTYDPPDRPAPIGYCSLGVSLGKGLLEERQRQLWLSTFRLETGEKRTEKAKTRPHPRCHPGNWSGSCLTGALTNLIRLGCELVGVSVGRSTYLVCASSVDRQQTACGQRKKHSSPARTVAEASLNSLLHCCWVHEHPT